MSRWDFLLALTVDGQRAVDRGGVVAPLPQYLEEYGGVAVGELLRLKRGAPGHDVALVAVPFPGDGHLLMDSGSTWVEGRRLVTGAIALLSGEAPAGDAA